MTARIDRAVVRVTRALRNPINTAAIIILSTYTFIWGLWVVVPFWHVFERAPLYDILSAVAPEWFWGCTAILAGFVMMWGVYKNSYRSLTQGAFVGFCHWLLIGLLYFIGDWQSTGGITALMVAAYCAFVYLNLRINRGVMDKTLVD